MGLGPSIKKATENANQYQTKGYYTEAYPGSHEYNTFWENNKKLVYTGLLIDSQHYVTGDHLWYLNYTPIPDKVKRQPDFPDLWDTDIWWYNQLQLAFLQGQFTLTLKKRQCLLGDSVVYTPEGHFLIKDLVERNYRGKLWSYQNGQIVEDYCEDAFVSKVVDKYLTVVTAGGSFLQCTHDHEILTDYGWVQAQNLNTSSFVITNIGPQRVLHITEVSQQVPVYDLTTRNTRNFIANGIVVHNCGFSLKIMSKILKRVYFEKGFSGKVAAWDEAYNKTNWSILDDYRAFLNENTAWYRPFEPDKVGNWKQVDKTTNKGNRSILKWANTKNNPASVVSGKTDEIAFDEAGVAPNLDETIGFVEPALRQGDIITGEMNVFGAVGKLDKSGPLKDYFYNPSAGNFLSVPNRWSNRPHEKVGLFIPEYYSYGSFIDEYGNSLVEEAKAAIEAKAEQEKEDKGFKAYALFLSQHPITPEDCFSIRNKNIFPTDIIKPHYENLLREYKPILISLKDNNGKIDFTLGSTTGIVTDYPVTFNSFKEGAVVMDEAPIPNPPFGLYYASTDPIKPINTQTSESLMSTYIYKAAHEIDGEFAQDKAVAWFTGRHEDPYTTYQKSLDLVKMYNARWAVENDQPVFIEWLIGQKENNRLMKRSEMPILKEWVPTSQINEEYGWRTGSGQSKVKDHLYELVIMYCKEIIGTTFNTETGESQPIYGVTRIKDTMLLKEMLDYNGNTDRIIAFGGALMAARSNTNRGIKVRTTQNDAKVREDAIKNYKRMNSFGPGLKINTLKRTVR